MPRGPGWGEGLCCVWCYRRWRCKPCSAHHSATPEVISCPFPRERLSIFISHLPPVLHTLILVHFWNHCDFCGCGYKTRPSMSSATSALQWPAKRNVLVGTSGWYRETGIQKPTRLHGEGKEGWRETAGLQGALLGLWAGRGHPKAPAGLQCTVSLCCHVHSAVFRAFLFEDL